jgi:hypothetical protein
LDRRQRFGPLDFEFVSDFEFRASDLKLDGSLLAVKLRHVIAAVTAGGYCVQVGQALGACVPS